MKREAVNSGIWQEQTIFSEENGKSWRYILAWYQDPIANQQAEIIFKSPYQNFSPDFQEMMMNLQKSMQFKNNF